MSTETVTVVFTDMVGSTALSARLRQEEADELRRNFFAVLREAVVGHRGIEVKNLGDGLMAVFANPSAALTAAAAMQQGVARLSRSTSWPVALRVGVSAGEVETEENDYFGEPVVEASRLCGRAEGGQILVAALVRAMAGRRANQTFVPVGDLDLKGLPEPVTTLEMSWDLVRSDESRIPFPGRLADLGTGFFGRGPERDELAAALDQAASGHRQVVLIGGEPGIGKTSLTSVIARMAHDKGWTVLYGRCEEDLGVPYQPFIEALRTYVTQGPTDVLEAHVAAHGGELGHLVPELHRRLPNCPAPRTSDPATERYLAVGAATGLLSLASRDAPLLIALDDLHWADRPTLQLLSNVAQSTEVGQLVVLGTYRTTDLGSSHPLTDALASFRRERAVKRMLLSGLDLEDVVALIESASGEPLAAGYGDLAAALRDDTGGNPFFVWSMLRHLAESGALTQSASGHWSADEALVRAGLPHSVYEVIGQRVRRLGPDTEQLLGMASVIGRDFEIGVLSAAAEFDEDRTLDCLESAEQASLVAETVEHPGRFTFNHSLIEHTLYDSLGTARRRRAHQKVAETLEQRSGRSTAHAGTLAYHWNEAGYRERALHYSTLAGHAALESLAPDEAVRWFEQSLALLPSGTAGQEDLRVDLLTDLGTAQRLVGDTSFRETLLKAGILAGELDDPARMARAALENNRGFYSSVGTEDVERIAALQAALDRLDGGDSAEGALLLATLAAEATFGTGVDCVDVKRRAKAMAERLGDPVTELRVINLVAETLRSPVNLAERLVDCNRGLELSAGIDDPGARYWAVGNRMRATFEAGLLMESRRLFDEMTALAEEVGQPVMTWLALATRGHWALFDGELDEAERVVGEAFALGQASGQPDALVYYGGALIHSLWQHGNAESAIALLEEGAEANPGIPGYYAGLARAAAQGGLVGRAQELLDAARAQSFEHLPPDLLWASGMSMYAECAVLLGDRAAAGLLYEELEPWADQFAYIGTYTEGPIAHYLGALATVVGRYDDAERHFALALDMVTRPPAPFHLAHLRLELGRMLVARGGPGDVTAAIDNLTEARTIAAKRGYENVVARADEGLESLAVR